MERPFKIWDDMGCLKTVGYLILESKSNGGKLPASNLGDPMGTPWLLNELVIHKVHRLVIFTVVVVLGPRSYSTPGSKLFRGWDTDGYLMIPWDPDKFANL